MKIERIGVQARWSDIVIHGGTVYVVEVPATVEADVTTQTREVLASLEDSLRQAGSSKGHLLMVTIFLEDIRELDAFNAVWDAWVPPGTAPVRACVQARTGAVPGGTQASQTALKASRSRMSSRKIVTISRCALLLPVWRRESSRLASTSRVWVVTSASSLAGTSTT